MNLPATTELLVIRHGQTVWNLERRIQGQLDSPLTDLGQKQTEAVSRSLEGLEFDSVYSSDLGRALAMGETIGRLSTVEVLRDERLRERHHGLFQGLTHPEIAERFPREYARYRVRGDTDVPIPEGESLRQLYERAVSFLEEIGRVHPSSRVVVVTHGGVLDSLLRAVLGLDLGAPRNFLIHNASRNRFRLRGTTWCLEQWGDVRHLKAHLKAPDPRPSPGSCPGSSAGEPL